MFDWNLSSTGCWQSGFSSQLWISRNEKTNLEFKKSGWSLPALHISHIPLAKRALWLSFITKIMIKIAQNSPVQHKNTRNSLVILFYFTFGTGQRAWRGLNMRDYGHTRNSAAHFNLRVSTKKVFYFSISLKSLDSKITGHQSQVCSNRWRPQCTDEDSFMTPGLSGQVIWSKIEWP